MTIEGKCYSQVELKKIADGITELYQCRVALAERERLIQEKLTSFGDSGPAWWQEPSVVLGGIVVSASVATILTVWLVRRD